LENGGAVCYTKEHYQRFKIAIVHVEGCLPFITRPYADIIESLANIWLSVIDFLKLSDQLRDQWKQVFVLDSYHIWSSIVLYQSKQAIFFLDKKD